MSRYHAIEINARHFCYVCPYEASICAAVVHRHGSGRIMHNRIESRSSHCAGDTGDEFGRIEIVIDDTTARKTLYIKNGTMAFKKYRT